MRPDRTLLLVLALAALCACYGTKAPAPVRSDTPPPGLGPSLSDSIALPPHLPELLARYRVFLVERAHHLRHEVAERYADAEIASLKQRYAGRDDQLQAELVRRMSPPPPRQQRPAVKSGATAFPADPETDT